MADANQVVEVRVSFETGADPLKGRLKLGRGRTRIFSGWPELAELIAAASEPETGEPPAGHSHATMPVELALSSDSPSTVTLRCYVADPGLA